jgi:hypothetical protein
MDRGWLSCIAEGPLSRTTQWTATLNFRIPKNDFRGGQVQHELAETTVSPPIAESQSLDEFLKHNIKSFCAQIDGYWRRAAEHAQVGMDRVKAEAEKTRSDALKERTSDDTSSEQRPS